MSVVSMKQLLEAGVHFGHQTRRWNPKMARYIFTERNGIYIIDLQKTVKKVEEAYAFIREVAATGAPILFVGTKKQAQNSVREEAQRCNMFYVNERWLGGMLTNFRTIQARVARLKELEKMFEDGTTEQYPKKEVILMQRELEKLQKNLGGIKDMKKIPGAIFMVKELRNSTGAGMMDCKKALVEADGNMAKAIDILREKGLSQAAKKASRIAAEGAVVSYISENGKIGVITEVNCETDFVGYNENFQALAKSIAAQIASVNPADVAVLLDSTMGDKTVKDVVTEAIANIGENISIRRFTRYESTEGQVYSYIHGGGKIGVLVEIKGGDAELGKDIAMQVAAANPSYLERSQVSKEELEHEKEVLREQARNEGKPENVVEKMVTGRVNKYYKEVCLVDQPFIKDGDLSVAKLLQSKSAEVIRFSRFQLGEGIEKKQDNLAEEVAKQINQ